MKRIAFLVLVLASCAEYTENNPRIPHGAAKRVKITTFDSVLAYNGRGYGQMYHARVKVTNWSSCLVTSIQYVLYSPDSSYVSVLPPFVGDIPSLSSAELMIPLYQGMRIGGLNQRAVVYGDCSRHKQ